MAKKNKYQKLSQYYQEIILCLYSCTNYLHLALLDLGEKSWEHTNHSLHHV